MIGEKQGTMQETLRMRVSTKTNVGVEEWKINLGALTFQDLAHLHKHLNEKPKKHSS